MENKRGQNQRNNQKKPGEDQEKYLKAVEAWIGDADNLENKLKDIPILGNLKETTKEPNPKKGNGTKSLKSKKGKVTDEANDNIDVDGMLLNIMDALKDDDQTGLKKSPNKKRTYSPTKKNEMEAQNQSQNVLDSSDTNLNQEFNPFAKSLVSSAKITEAKGQLSPTTDFQNLPNTNIQDLSAIAGEPMVRGNIDSRGSSLPTSLLSPNTKQNFVQDRVLSPELPNIDSPERIGLSYYEVDTTTFGKQPASSLQASHNGNNLEQKSSTGLKKPDDSKDQNWINFASDLELEKSITQEKQNTGPLKKEEKKDRRFKALELLAELAADDKPIDSFDNPKKEMKGKKKEKAKLGAGSAKKKDLKALSPNELPIETKKTIYEDYDQNDKSEHQFFIDENQSPTNQSPNSKKFSHEFSPTHFDRVPVKSLKFSQQPDQQTLAHLVDETQDTALLKERPNSGLSNILINEKLTTTFDKDSPMNKNRLLDVSDNSPLDKRPIKEADSRIEEDLPLLINFRKRRSDSDDSIIIDHETKDTDTKDLFEKPKIIELEEIDTQVSKTMINLFLGFKKKVSGLEYMVQEVRKPEYTLDTFFQRNFTFFKGKLKITKNFFFLFLMLSGVMIYFIFDTLQASDLSRVKNDEKKQYLAKWLIPAAIIFTYYGIAFLYIPKKFVKYIVAIQMIPALVILGIDVGTYFLQNASFKYEKVYICIYVISVNVFWSVTRALRQDILTNYSWGWSMFFMTSWCILLPTAIIAYAIYFSVVSRRFNYNWVHELVIHIGIPCLILLCLTWVYYHFKFFVPATKKKSPIEKKSSSHQQVDVYSKEAEEKIREQFAEISEDEEDKKEEKQPLKLRIYTTVKLLLVKIADSVIVASSLSLGGSLIFIEGLLLIYLSETSTEKIANEGAFYLAVFLYFLIPTTILFGIPIMATSKYHERKMFLVPLIAILFPLFITMPISYLLLEYSNTNSIGIFLILTPTIITAFWLTLSYIGLKRKRTKFGFISFIFICFVVPLFILQPLIDIDAFKAVKVAEVFCVILLAIGIIILIVAIAYLISRGLLIKELSQKDRLNTDNYKMINIFKTNLEPFGYWSNSLGFIINFTVSLFTLFHGPGSAPSGLRGTSLGLAFCFLIFFIYNNILLRLHIIETNEISKFGIKSLSAAIIESVKDNELYDEMQKIREDNEKLKGFTRLLTLIGAIASIVISLMTSNSNSFISSTFSTLAIGIVTIQILFEICTAIKAKFASICKAAIPLLLTYFWFTHALAFPSILQLTKVFFSDNERRQKRMELQLIVLVFVITVSIIAIIANIIFKGIELEQKIKYILAYLRQQLENIAVKSDYFVLQRVFEGWMENGEMRLKKTLINRGKPAFWWPIPVTNPNTKYSKVLLDFEAYKYMKLRLQKKLEKEDAAGITTKNKKKHRSWISRLLSCFGLCFPWLFKNKRVHLDDELNEEIEELLDLEMYDVPLPPKDEDEESDESDDDYDPGDLGDWKIEGKIVENKIEITEAIFKPLDERVLRAMMYYDSGIKFAYSDKFYVDFLKFVFRLFAVGNYKFFKKRWLDYLGYKRFMILSAIASTQEFPDYMIDLVYTIYTHNVGRGQIERRVDYSNKKNEARKKQKKNPKEVDKDQKIKLKVFPIFEEDFEGFLTHIAKKRFPHEINDRDALFRLVRWHLFPNFLHLLPSVQKEYPHEYDYLLYLIDLYMKQNKSDNNGEANLDGGSESQIIFNGENGKDKNKSIHVEGSQDSKGQSYGNKEGLGLNGNRSKPNCIKVICRGLSGCIGFLLNKILEFFVNFFFLKTHAQKKADKEFEIMQQIADKEERDEVRKIRADKKAETDLGQDPNLLEEELNKKGQFRRMRKTYPHRPSPDWPIIVETVIKSLKDAENDYEHKKSNGKQPYFTLSIRNLLTILAKITEIYSLACFAFRREVPWGWSSNVQNYASLPSGSIDDYHSKIWSSLAFSIFYCYIGLISINFAKEGVLGFDRTTRKAGEFPSRGFAHSQLLTYFSTTFSVWVIKSFLDMFLCDFTQDTYKLFFAQDVQCYSSSHIRLIIVAAFGLLFYYPISSFLYPNLQYLNVGNDIKYDPSFVVLFNQGKLIIIAVTVFFPYKDEVLIPLFISTAIWIGLAIINKILNPNVVKVLNLWETSFYFMGAWVQVSAIIVYFTKDTVLATVLLFIGIFVIFVATFVIHRYYRSNSPNEPIAPVKSAALQSKTSRSIENDKKRLETKDSFLPLANQRTELDLSNFRIIS